MPHRVLIVEDDAQVQRLLGYFLARADFDLEAVGTAAQARAALARELPEALVVDRGLPDGDGLALCREFRGSAPGCRELPMIVVSGQLRPDERCEAFEAGACDFVAKPFDPEEIIWRLRAHLGECGAKAGPQDCMAVGRIFLDTRNHVVVQDERRTALTPNECAILRKLMEAPGRAFAVETLLVEALGYPPRLGNPEIVRTHVRNLRLKLERDPREPALIVNLPRVGYAFHP